LQKFLQKKGYYKNCKIDGDYLSETKKAVTQLQKAYKIKVSKANQGVWDKTTRDYWRKKYNITSKKKDKTATAILSSNIGKMMK
jgi:peptidoglycan hydrolase-like protein with peptidoglycan-binding domain